jgi:alpha-ketoglutarate-dependent taurine dioxygenase
MLEKPRLQNLATVRSRPIRWSQEQLVELRPFSESDSRLRLARPRAENVDLISWAGAHRALIQDTLLEHGGILFRGFGLRAVEQFNEFVQTTCGDLLTYSFASTPRSVVSGRIYTSTEFPPEQHIPLHNEMSYSRQWPLKIAFFCVKIADDGGETPLADSRRVFERISAAIRETFKRRNVMYVRNYGHGMDLPWERVFGTTQRSEVEDYCRRANIELEWKPDGGLRTRQVCQAIARHPQTGETVWFNQAHLFHVSSLDETVRKTLASEYEEVDFPRNAFYGDGSPIESAVLDQIRAVYRQETIVFPWEEGDLLLLDNMLIAHGRRPFAGTRRVLVGMAEPHGEGAVSVDRGSQYATDRH